MHLVIFILVMSVRSSKQSFKDCNSRRCLPYCVCSWMSGYRLSLGIYPSLFNNTWLAAVPLQAWIGPEGSRKLRFPDFMTTAQDGGKDVSLTHRPLLPQEIHLVLISVRGWFDPRAIVRPAGLWHWKIPMTPSGIELATCNTWLGTDIIQPRMM
jgi:hypothetical protein